MSHPDSTQERRDFFRLKLNSPVQFKTYPNRIGAQIADDASSKDISSAGILFQTTSRPPELSSILWLNLDYRMLSICQELDRRALICSEGILGRVVRVEEDPENNNAYDIGVCFFTKEQQSLRDVQKAIEELSQSRA